MKNFKRIIKRVLDITKKPEMKILPGNIAFYLVVSIAPIITLIGVLCSTMSISTATLSNFMNQYFPEQISSILVPYFSGQGVNINVIIFTIIGFFVASNGTSAIITASNSLYHIEEDNYVKKRIKAFNMIFLLIMLIIFMLVFMAFGNKIITFLIDNILGNLGSGGYYVYLIIKWPLGFLFIFFIVKLIYTLAPGKRIPSRYVTKGSLFTTVLWIIGTAIYGYYISNIANYSLFYGNLSSIVILMFWFYYISYILVIGIVINASAYYNINNLANNVNNN